jgi:hypothetical protein
MSSSSSVDAYVCDSTMFLENRSQDLRQMLDHFRSGYHEQYPHQYCEYRNRLISFKTKIRDFQKQGQFYYILKYNSGYDEDEPLWKYASTNHNLLYSLLVRSYMKNPSPYAKKDDISPDAEVIWPVVTSGITDIAEALRDNLAARGRLSVAVFKSTESCRHQRQIHTLCRACQKTRV